MFKDLLKLYGFIICSVSSLIMLVALCLTFVTLTDIIFTEYKNYDRFSNFASNSSFLQENNKRPELKKLSDDELSKIRLNEKELKLDNIKKRSLGILITQATWVLLSGLFLVIHFRYFLKPQKIE